MLPNGSAARVKSAAEAARGGEREGRLRRDEGSAGLTRRVATASHRSGRNARRAGPREARFVHVVDLARQSRVMVFAWWNPCIIRPHCAADSGAGGELLCFCAEPQTSREVDQDLEGGLTRQCNARLLVCFYSLKKHITRRRRRASSPSRSSPTPASLVKTRSGHLIVPLFF